MKTQWGFPDGESIQGMKKLKKKKSPRVTSEVAKMTLILKTQLDRPCSRDERRKLDKKDETREAPTGWGKGRTRIVLEEVRDK